MASIRKRSWVSRGVRRERWIADYVDQAGVRRLKTFPSKKAADAWLITARHEVQQGTHTPMSSSITVAEATGAVDCALRGGRARARDNRSAPPTFEPAYRAVPWR